MRSRSRSRGATRERAKEKPRPCAAMFKFSTKLHPILLVFHFCLPTRHPPTTQPLFESIRSVFPVNARVNLPMPSRQQDHPDEQARRRKKGITFILTAFILGLLCSTHPKQYLRTPQPPERPKHRSHDRRRYDLDDDDGPPPPRRVAYASEGRYRDSYSSRPYRR